MPQVELSSTKRTEQHCKAASRAIAKIIAARTPKAVSLNAEAGTDAGNVLEEKPTASQSSVRSRALVTAHSGKGTQMSGLSPNATAFHEASHAVIDHSLGVTILSVTIKNCGDAAGCCVMDRTDFEALIPEDQIKCLIAGEVGEELFLGKAWSYVPRTGNYVGKDYPKARQIGKSTLQESGAWEPPPLPVSEKDATAYWQQDQETKARNGRKLDDLLEPLRYQVQETLRKKQVIVEALAAALLQHRP